MVKQTIQIFARLKPTKGKRGQYEIYGENESDVVGSVLSFNIPREASDGIVNNKRELFKFSFERVFDVQTKQEEVFDVVARPVIDNVLEGYNGTIFAYGQTGSGKTFTITGGAERYADRGIIPRALSYIFDLQQRQTDCQFTTLISYLEIYNENGYDLLDPKHEASKLDDLPKVTLMEDSDQNIHLRNLSTHQANNEEEALNLLFLGDTNRMIAETPMNQASTRSHCIFTIHIMSRVAGSATVRRSKLHLVDLAGSERVSKSGVNGLLLTEAKYINLSLHYLEQVIIALSESRRQHIPYRNSMMTSVLRDSLGGNCMTTMIANCAIDRQNIEETISTCRFAQRVALIKNDAVLNEELDPKLMIDKLKREVQQLKEELILATGEQRTDELTEDDKRRCEELVKCYVDDSDVDAVLPVGADLRSVKYCFQLLKGHILARSACTGVASAGDGGSGPSNQTQDGLLKELQELRDMITQRDNEINILVSMLKKERAKNSSATTSSATVDHDTTLVAGSKWTTSAKQHHHQQQQQQHLSMDDSEQKTRNKIFGSMSLGRQEAYELFCRDYAHNDSIAGNKHQLKTLTIEAKHLGEQLAQTRKNINQLKSALKQQQASLAAAGVVDFESREPTDEERQTKQQLEHENIKYKGTVQRLQQLKLEIEHLQHLLEVARVKLMKDFDSWWISQTSQIPTELSSASPSPRSHNSRQGSIQSAARSHPAASHPTVHSLYSTQDTADTGHIALTGDSEADADILAFMQARQKVIRQAESASSRRPADDQH